jgi:hypothetical protein
MVDPYQIRRDLIAIRSNHSGNDTVTAPINKLLGKIAHMREADSPALEAELNRLVAKALKELPAGIITEFWHEPKTTGSLALRRPTADHRRGGPKCKARSRAGSSA